MCGERKSSKDGDGDPTADVRGDPAGRGREGETETEADTVGPAAPVASTQPDLCGLRHGGGAGAERRRGRGGA